MCRVRIKLKPASKCNTHEVLNIAAAVFLLSTTILTFPSSRHFASTVKVNSSLHDLRGHRPSLSMFLEFARRMCPHHINLSIPSIYFSTFLSTPIVADSLFYCYDYNSLLKNCILVSPISSHIFFRCPNNDAV